MELEGLREDLKNVKNDPDNGRRRPIRAKIAEVLEILKNARRELSSAVNGFQIP